MDHIRGEKVMFGKGDFHPLDALPSACREDAVVLATPRGRSVPRICAKFFVGVVLILSAVVGLLLVGLEEGYLDETLTTRAELQLSAALGDQFKPKVGSIRLRFTRNWLLALAAGDVTITHIGTGVTVLKTDSLKVVFNPVAMAMGRLEVARAEIGAAEGDLRFLPASAPIDWKTLRIDAVPQWLDILYPQLDATVAALKRADTEHIVAGRLTLLLPKPTPQGDRVTLTDLDFSHPLKGRYMLRTDVGFGKLKPRLTMALDVDGDKTRAVNVNVTAFDAGKVLMKYSKLTHEKRYGVELPLEFGLTAERGKSLMLSVGVGKGLFYADGITQDVTGGGGLLRYDFKDRKILLDEGLIDVSPTRLPIVGTLMDLDRQAPGHPPGYAFELVSNEAVSQVAGLDLPPQNFSLKTSGFFVPQNKLLQLDSLGVATKEGNFAGSLAVTFAEPSPAVNFAARADQLTVDSVRQIWPYWFAPKVRDWVARNIAGGMMRNGQIDVSLAAGRIPEHPIPLVFQPGEIHVALDVDEASVRFIKEMPVSRRTSGHIEMRDRDVLVNIAKGEVPLPSGAVLKTDGGAFEIKDISKKPLMAEVDLGISGPANGAAEIAGFPPINAMSRAPVQASDLSGKISGEVQVVFGLEKDKNPPKPDWNVALDLDHVAIKKPFRDRKISDLTGALNIDTEVAKLDAEALVDGVRFKVGGVEPIDPARAKERLWTLSGALDTEAIHKISPGLSDLIAGDVGVDISGTGGDDGDQAKIDLGPASLSIPGIGWRKGPGVPATAQFKLMSKGGVVTADNFKLSGDGFGANGAIKLDKAGLVSAKFSQVQLSASDNFSVAIARKTGGLAIDVSGASVDLRPLLEKMKTSGGGMGGGGDGPKTSDSVTARLDQTVGHNRESLSDVTLQMRTRKGEVERLDFSGVTRTGQAVVVRKNADSGAIELTSGDAGALARFADLYKNMSGGLLNLSLKLRQPSGAWSGYVDIRNFALVNEQRLNSIVSARTGAHGESLSDALKTEIDTSSQKFRRGFARVVIAGKQVKVENGIARGDQVGATFQGTVRDENGRVDVTGTFMPAYGLNSLFSKLPIIGDILGNGRDRGLLGITFKLEGPYDAAKLTVNPLSLIAPGVFRNIFEFE